MGFSSAFKGLSCRCCPFNIGIFLFPYGSTVPVVLDLLIAEVSKQCSVRHTTICITSGDRWTANRRHIYLITHITHKRQASMAQAGFKPAIRGAAESPHLRPRGHW